MNNIWLYIIASLVILGLVFLIQDVFWSFWENTINDKNIDVVQYSDSDDFVDLTFIIRDHILLMEPFQRLCSKDCKGLCLICGDNMNITSCNCLSSNADNRWDSLKKFIDKKN